MTAMHARFTYSGLETLGVPDEILASFPAEFREGMAARAERLGDRGPSAPEHWEPGLGHRRGARPHHRLRGRQRVARRAPRGAAPRSARRTARRPSSTRRAPRRCPAARTTSASSTGSRSRRWRAAACEARPGDGQPDGAGGWRDVCTGEFLHGHIDEDGNLPDAPAAPFDRNGTFEVYRKLADGRGRLPRLHGGEGARVPGRPGHARGQDRRPLERRDAAGRSRPMAPTPASSTTRGGSTTSRYADDPEGLRCPLGLAHPPRQPARRRGLLQGPHDQPPPHHPARAHLRAAAARGRHRGRRPGARARVRVLQRETSSASSRPSRRCGSTTATRFGLGRDKDFLIGEPDGDGKMTIPGRPPFFLKPQPRFVTLRGGEYLYPAEHQRAALDGRSGRRGLVARARPGSVTARRPSRASAGAPCNRTRRSPAP